MNKILLEALVSVHQIDGIKHITPPNWIGDSILNHRTDNDINYTDSVKKSIETALSDDSKNIPLQAAITYTKKHNLPLYDKSLKNSVSSLSKQAAIGVVYAEAVKGTDGYKKAVFSLYQKHHPELIKEHHIKDYDDLVDKSYSQLAKETKDQFKSIPSRTQFHNGELDYKTSNEMLGDIHHHNNITVFSGGDRHEYLHNIDKNTGLNENQMFRAVHDYYGHGIHGNQFGAKGEEIAWESHAKMFSPLARLAMTSETRGQNSFVNYTNVNIDRYNKMETHRKLAREALHNNDMVNYQHHKESISKLGKDWKYAPQKAIILPPSMNEVDYKGSMPKSIHKLIGNNGVYDVDKDPLHLIQLARSKNTTSYLSNHGGIYDRENTIRDFNSLLSHHGYTNVSKIPNL